MFVYILSCRDGTLYTGWTGDLSRRLRLHEAGRASKYTRARLPVRLLAWIEAASASSARSLEARFKQLSRREKLTALETGQAFGEPLHKAS